MNRTRIYVFLGNALSLVDMMVAMDASQLFSNGEYMVIYVDTMNYSLKYININYLLYHLFLKCIYI